MLSVGLAYHHSGLSLEEREMCESLYKQGLVKVLFCTSTLAAGVNLPAGRVIITSTKQAGNRSENLSSIQYKQMVGRAGRTGQSTHGDSILVTNDRGLALKIATKDLEPVQSCLADEKKGQSRLVLEAIGIGLATTEPELLAYMKSTLLWQQQIATQESESDNTMKWLLTSGRYALDFLLYNEIVTKTVKVSQS